MDTSKPLLSGTVALIVGTLGTLLAAASPAIPAPWGFLVGLLGFLAATLAGHQAAPPKFIDGRPVLQGTLLTVALTVAGLLEQYWQLVPAGWPQSVALAAGALLGWLTGKSLPQLGALAPKPFVDASGTPVLGGSKAAADVLNKAGGALLVLVLLFQVLGSSVALGQEVTDAGAPAPGAVAVESATLRPVDAPTVPVEVGAGVYLPESLAVSTAAKVQAYEAAKAQAAVETPTSPVVWLVAGALVVAFGGGVGVGWWASTASAKK